jgi:hypothetical protein
METTAISGNEATTGTKASAAEQQAPGAEPAHPAETNAASPGQPDADDNGWHEVEASIDPAKASQSFEGLQTLIDGLDEDEVIALRIDAQRMAAIVLSLARRDLEPMRRAVFERFARDGYYDASNLERMPALAECVWHVRRRQQRLSFSASGATVPEGEVRVAYETRARMMTVLDYWLGDRHDIATDLAQLREGAGYQDLANDLGTLAELYGRDDVRPFLEHDTKHYRAADADDATRFAKVLMLSLGIGKEAEAKRLTKLAQRVSTLLVRSYEEHSRCGRFLFGLREDVTVTYPSLYAVGRNPRRRRPASEPAGEGQGEAPAEEGFKTDPGRAT